MGVRLANDALQQALVDAGAHVADDNDSDDDDDDDDEEERKESRTFCASGDELELHLKYRPPPIASADR
jgi:hypothetical protein